MCLSGRKFNNLRFIVKCRCKLRDRKKYDHTDNFCKQCRTGNAKIRTFALSYCFAPRFCPMNVVSDIAKQVIGKNANPSIFE